MWGPVFEAEKQKIIVHKIFLLIFLLVYFVWGPIFEAEKQKILVLLSLQGKMKSLNPLIPPQKHGAHTLQSLLL